MHKKGVVGNFLYGRKLFLPERGYIKWVLVRLHMLHFLSI